MKKEIEIKTVKVIYECDDCGGEVTSFIIPELKPQETYCGNPVRHECEKCDREYYLDKPYPHIKYIEVI